MFLWLPNLLPFCWTVHLVLPHLRSSISAGFCKLNRLWGLFQRKLCILNLPHTDTEVHKAFYGKYNRMSISHMRKQCAPGLSSRGRGLGTRLLLSLLSTRTSLLKIDTNETSEWWLEVTWMTLIYTYWIFDFLCFSIPSSLFRTATWALSSWQQWRETFMTLGKTLWVSSLAAITTS